MDQETKIQKRGSTKMAIGVRSFWQSEKVEMQRKVHRDHSSNVCASRETGSEKIKGAGELVTWLGRRGTAAHIYPV